MYETPFFLLVNASMQTRGLCATPISVHYTFLFIYYYVLEDCGTIFELELVNVYLK